MHTSVEPLPVVAHAFADEADKGAVRCGFAGEGKGVEAAEGRGGQTSDVRWSPEDELRLLVTHGALHLCGWDHAETAERVAMRALEAELLGLDVPR